MFYLLAGIAIAIAIKVLRSFTTKFLLRKFAILCKFKGLLGIQEFSLKQPLKDLIGEKLSLVISNVKIRYISSFKFQIQIDSIVVAMTLKLIKIELVKSFVSDKEKIAIFLHNVLQMRGKLSRFCD